MKLPSNLSWLKQHYEKAILIVVLLGLLVSAAILARHITTRAEALKATGQPVFARPDQGFKDLDFSIHSNGLAQLTSPMQVADVSNRLCVSEVRVYCIQCGKWIEIVATKCPFCEAEQPELVKSVAADSDKDGIPDIEEQKLGLDMYNRDDVQIDHDGDGFTTIEEYTAKTDPRDPKSLPSIFAKLRLRGVQTSSFKLRFVAVQKLSETVLVFQINARTLDRTYFKKIGDEVEGYKLDSYDKATDSLTLKKGATVKRLQRGKVIDDDQLIVHFLFLLDGNVKPICRVGETFELRDQKARVLEVTADRRTAKVKHEAAEGAEYIMTLPTSEEEAALRLRMENPLGASAEFTGAGAAAPGASPPPPVQPRPSAMMPGGGALQ